MMKGFFSLTVGVLCLSTALQAEVPSLINYQGRLTDSGGTPVNGAIDVVLRVYDAKTEGKMVYEETISQVSAVNGVYSFGYGSAGKTVKRAAEVVAVADGETKVFNYATEYKPLLGDVQLSDGSYTWGTLSGPSDATQFIGSVNAELGNVTGIYIQNAPDADKIINVVYHYHEEGIVGALSQNKECWQELTINEKTLSPRERLISVPFALVSAYSKNLYPKIKRFRIPSAELYLLRGPGGQSGFSFRHFYFPLDLNFNFRHSGAIPRLNKESDYESFGFHIPQYVSEITHLKSKVNYKSATMKSRLKLVFLIIDRNTQIKKISEYPLEEGLNTINFDNVVLDHNNYDYFLKLDVNYIGNTDPGAIVHYFDFIYK